MGATSGKTLPARGVKLFGAKTVALALTALIALACAMAYAGTAGKQAPTRLYVLSIGYGDALIIENDGMFGIIDSGESADSPDGSDSRYPLRDGIAQGNGVEGYLFPLLDELGVSADKGNLQFYIGTHPHSDHIGTAAEVIEKYRPRFVYTPYYDDSMMNNEDALWDNQYVYDNLVNAAHGCGSVLIQEYDPNADPYPAPDGNGNAVGNPNFKLGQADISILGFSKGEALPPGDMGDANEISYEVLLKCNGYRTFLAGDVDDIGPSEHIIAKTVGEVDVLKLGHHGNEGAGRADFIHALSPAYAIQTGSEYALAGETTRALMDEGAKYYPTSEAVDEHLPALVFIYDEYGITVNMEPYELGLWG
ncbi:MBL fold metallo-hydrolase [Curtanaerobium respiraculi]|uniref:MBL fold metallo-hydrolase n=1 Tax=Curtanaerobium respiraculi TaxID=2949669 RepID=UPI0024B3AD18|nr:MBL fold metallo-hydrolase [Curtanaerobium respiraculi]